MTYSVNMGATTPNKPREKDEVEKIIDFIREKKTVLETLLPKPLFELQKNFVYNGMMKDVRMKKIISRLLSDPAFRRMLHEEIVYTFGNTFSRQLGRIILPPGSLWP